MNASPTSGTFKSSSFPSRLLLATTRFGVRRPILTLSVVILATLCSLWRLVSFFSDPNFGVESRPSLDKIAKIYGKDAAEFALGQNAYFVVEGEPSAVRACAGELARGVFLSDDFLLVPPLFDANSFTNDRLFLLPDKRIADLAEPLYEASEIARGRWDVFAADRFASRLSNRASLSAARPNVALLDESRAFLSALEVAFDPQTTVETVLPSPIASNLEKEAIEASGEEFFLAQDGRIAVVQLLRAQRPNEEKTSVLDAALRATLERARTNYPNLTIDLTSGATRFQVAVDAGARVLGLALVVAALGTFFAAWTLLGTIRRAAFLLASVAAATSWTFALFVSFAPCAIPVLGASLLVFGTSLELAYAFLTQYGTIRVSNRSSYESSLEAAKSLDGAPLVVAFAIVAASCAASCFARETLSEFALFVALGVLCAVVASTLFLPVLTRLFDGSRPMGQDSAPLDLFAYLTFLQGSTKRVFAVVAFLGVFAVVGLSLLDVERNLALFFPQDALEADKRVSRALASVTGRGRESSLVPCADVDEALLIKRRLEEESSFRVEELASKLPSYSPDKARAIERFAEAVAPVKLEIGASSVPNVATLLRELDEFAVALRDQSIPSTEAELEAIRTEALAALIRSDRRLRETSDEEYRRRIETFQWQTAVDALKRLFALRAISDSNPPTLDDLSPELRALNVGASSERVALRVYTTEDLIDGKKLNAFVSNARRIAPNASGEAAFVYERARIVRRDACAGFLVAFALLFAFWGVWSRDFTGTLLTFAPGALAALFSLGLCGWLGVSVEPLGLCLLALFFPYGVFNVPFWREESVSARFDACLVPNAATALSLVCFFLGVLFFGAPGLKTFARLGALFASFSCVFTALILASRRASLQIESEETK